MAYTNYTAAQAVTRANAVTKWETGMCLQFVMHCVHGVGIGIADANAAWTAAKQKETTGVPPAGAPVYFAGGKHGHIAVSVGGGKIRSTDYRTGYGYSAGVKGSLTPVGTATINEVALEFFGTTSAYRGWSRDYGGLLIRGLEKTDTDYSPIPPPLPDPTEDDMPLTDAEIAKIVQAVWSKTVSRDGKQISAIQELADAKTAAISAPARVWDRTIARNGQNVAAIQELADAKTYAMTAAGAAAILSRLDSLSAALPGLPDDADVAALKAQIAELKALVDALPKA